jgi:hypothetical protein
MATSRAEGSVLPASVKFYLRSVFQTDRAPVMLFTIAQLTRPNKEGVGAFLYGCRIFITHYNSLY